MAPQALARGMDVELERPDGPVPLLGHPFIVGELIANVLDNAIGYNRAGGTVTVRVAREGNGARVEIEDEGPGIPMAERVKGVTVGLASRDGQVCEPPGSRR